MYKTVDLTLPFMKFIITIGVMLSFRAFVSCSENGHSETYATVGITGDTVKEMSDSLTVILQDKKNNYWFGSFGQGVYRYDGKDIFHYTTKHGLSNDTIWQIQEDKQGNIYFNTVRTISKFDGHVFTTLRVAKTGSDSEWKIQADDLWFKGGQDSGVVYRYDGNILYRLEFPKTQAGDDFFSKYPRAKYPNMKFNPYDVYCIYKDSKERMWFGTGNLGVCCYEGKSFTWLAEDGLSESPVRCIIEDKHGNMLFGNSGQALFSYDSKTLHNLRKEKGVGNLKDYSNDVPVSYMSIAKDNKGDLWIATHREGIWRYEQNNITSYPVRNDSATVAVFSIYNDNSDNLWLGTNANGVYKFNGTTFERFKLKD
ncbi:MAG: hypothetical protein K0S32_12 [Bacteroidetes bacterium]|jgi:ligand-binding sensor domain-containing protein|nr:hypothetical protein [Bacteroidota bacterium]